MRGYLAALTRLLEVVGGGGGKERPRGEGARAPPPRPRWHHSQRERPEADGREDQEGGGQQRVLNVHRVVDVRGREADERLGAAIGDAAGPRERLRAHLLWQGASPHRDTQRGSRSIGADECGTSQAGVRLVGDERVGAGDSSEEASVADPEGTPYTGRKEGQVQPAARVRAQRFPGVLGGRGEHGKATKNQWCCRHDAGPREDAVRRGGHHGASWLVGPNRLEPFGNRCDMR